MHARVSRLALRSAIILRGKVGRMVNDQSHTLHTSHGSTVREPSDATAEVHADIIHCSLLLTEDLLV